MTSRLQIVGFLFATLTLSGVALAQQGGGGNGGGGSGMRTMVAGTARRETAEDGDVDDAGGVTDGDAAAGAVAVAAGMAAGAPGTVRSSCLVR